MSTLQFRQNIVLDLMNDRDIKGERMCVCNAYEWRNDDDSDR